MSLQLDDDTQDNLTQAHGRAATLLGLLCTEPPVFGTSGVTIGRRAGDLWLRVSRSSRRHAPRLIGQGVLGVERLIPESVPRPRLHDMLDWTEGDYFYQADLLDFAGSPVSSTPELHENPGLDDGWWVGLKAALTGIATAAGARVTPKEAWIEENLPKYLGIPAPAEIERITGHGDLQWANLTAGPLMILDWERWGLVPVGYDPAVLWVSSLHVPPCAERILGEFSEVLDTPAGRIGQLVAVAEMLQAVDRGYYPGLRPLLLGEAGKLTGVASASSPNLAGLAQLRTPPRVRTVRFFFASRNSPRTSRGRLGTVPRPSFGADTGISKSEVSRICADLDEQLTAFRDRQLDHTRFPYIYLDATYCKARVNHQIVARAVVVATGITEDGGREVLGLMVGDSETEVFWVEFLRSLRERGLAGVRLVIGDHHSGLVKSIRKVMLGAAYQRCRVHFLRNIFAIIPKEAAEMVAATIRTIFAQPAEGAVRSQLDTVAEMLGKQFPKGKAMLLGATDELTAFAAFPERHWKKIQSTNPLERINCEIKRRTDVVQVFPNDDALLRLVTAVLFEMHDIGVSPARRAWGRITFPCRYLPETSMVQIYPAHPRRTPADFMTVGARPLHHSTGNGPGP